MIESEKPAVAFPAELAIGARLTFLQRDFDCANVYKSIEQQSSELFFYSVNFLLMMGHPNRCCIFKCKPDQNFICSSLGFLRCKSHISTKET